MASSSKAPMLAPPGKPESSSKKKKFKNTRNVFSFKVQSRVLKHAIAGLADQELNPSGLGRMEVCNEGFEMSVYQRRWAGSRDEQVFGLLSLRASGLIDFSCTRSMVKMVLLSDIVAFLESNKARDADIVKVFNVDGSNHLSFKLTKRLFLGVPRRIPHEVPFSDTATITKFPTFSYGLKMDIPTDKLELFLNGVLAELPRTCPSVVSVTVDTNVSIRIGRNFLVTPDQDKRHAWLICPYYGSLRKTSTLADQCTLMLATNPRDSFAVRCDLKELGDFIYLQYATRLLSTKNFPTVGTFCPLSSR